MSDYQLCHQQPECCNKKATRAANIGRNYMVLYCNTLPSRTKNRRQAHAATVNNLCDVLGYHATFATELVPKDQLHRDKLPDEPKNWKQVLKHPHRHQFTLAADTEIDHLQSGGTFQRASRATAKKKNILPLVWMFKYKFDTASFLVKHKPRLCV